MASTRPWDGCSPWRSGYIGGPGTLALVGVAIHTAAMLAVTAAIAGVVYQWVGIEILRRAWLNVDALWVAGLVMTALFKTF
jgi:hypothetical protein